ncbi:MAG: hypothetical protein RR998_07120 [Oscillospiraceae bacterium]
MDTVKSRAIVMIAKTLSGAGVRWGIGASLLLYLSGICEDFNDMDIVVSESDITRAKELLSQIGIKTVRMPVAEYATEYFYEYSICGLDADVMCNFIVCNQGSSYRFDFGEDYDLNFVRFQDILLPLTRVEDWYVLYLMMPGREKRAEQIENYFKKSGNIKVKYLERALGKNLPQNIAARIDRLILEVQRDTI